MANGNGNGDGNANGIESGETVVSSIRAGMKREFAMMMKAQAECGIILGKRRVTRSQNSPLISKSDGNIDKHNINKKNKKEEKKEVAEEEKKVELVVVEEEEVKSDILDGNSDDEKKKNMVHDELEKEGSDMGKVLGEEGDNEGAMTKEPKDGTVESVNEDSVEIAEEENALDPKTEGPMAPRVEEALEVVEPPQVEAEKPTENVLPTTSKLEIKMSKKTPTKLKELLETGFLEGLRVRYIRGSRGSKAGGTCLSGVIKGSGVLCYCRDCNGSQVVTPNQFELHAGSGNKRPPEYIYLENGKSLRDILNICKDAPAESLELAVQSAIGQARPTFCLGCKAFMHQAAPDGPMLCASCVALRESENKTTELTDTNSRPSLPVSNIKSASKTSSSSRPRNTTQGRLTRKDLRLHKLVFGQAGPADGTRLSYYAKGKLLGSGYKSGSGIFCYCCNRVVSPSQFEAHAGCASRRKPYLQIYTPDGVSLHEWSLAIKKNIQLSTDDSDDVCSICQGMGELLCCDMCPRAFHKECVNLPSIPKDNWYCRYCLNMIEKEKFVEHNANAVAAGRVAGIDPVEEVKKRCVRIVGVSEPEVGGCILCRGHDFSSSDFGPRTVILCDQCEKEYHVGCLKEHGLDDLKELPNENWFCSKECSSIHSALQQLISDGDKELPYFLLSMIQQKREDQGAEDKISWRLLLGKAASEENRKWLSGAVSVFHDRFDPIGDSNKGRDLIPVMVYGRSNRDQDFAGMYCAVLTVNSTVVSAGIFRVFGQDVAEVPLVATSTAFQGKASSGYFQSLFFCIENLLASLNVRDLVLPAAPEAECIWKNKFGFQKIRAEQLKQFKKDYQMMIFQGTTVLHRSVARVGISPD
ncbi:unnamed protein product [Coffea canephora]|uniref:PHD-type domain-containing protein n=1 Tax=Coffea canephora TaxID=49390 RepID=A0A068UFP4_COFCA|nr:unnamed protein product [Coffea canephora]